MRVYLIARYSRHPEMQCYAMLLRGLGHTVTARWVDGHHTLTSEALEDEATEAERRQFALDDIADLMAAECCVAFTEPPNTTALRGGRHVEFGIAIASNIPVYVIGYRENVFYCLPQVRFFPNWAECFCKCFLP